MFTTDDSKSVHHSYLVFAQQRDTIWCSPLVIMHI